MTEEQGISNAFVCNIPTTGSNPPPVIKKKRSLPGTPDPEAEVVALSPKTLMATNRFLCEICGKGFQRDQNLQLHRRGHNLPWKLKQRTGNKELRKRVYVCPEKTCVHHHASRALGDLTGIKKHFCRKHGEKKWKCEKCSKRYAVQSDWKAHSKTCGTKEYKCDCGTPFSRRDSFVTHRAYCMALAEETARLNAASSMANAVAATADNMNYRFLKPSGTPQQYFSSIFSPASSCNSDETEMVLNLTATRGLPFWMAQGVASSQQINDLAMSHNSLQDYQNIHHRPLAASSLLSCNSNHLASVPSLYSNQEQTHQMASANMSATVLLQKAAEIGVTSSTTDPSLLGSFGLKFSDGKGLFSGFYGSNSNSMPSSSLENGVEDSTASNLVQMYPAAKRRHTQSEESVSGGGGGGETRDFLGVGVHTICHPSAVNGWI